MKWYETLPAMILASIFLLWIAALAIADHKRTK